MRPTASPCGSVDGDGVSVSSDEAGREFLSEEQREGISSFIASDKVTEGSAAPSTKKRAQADGAAGPVQLQQKQHRVPEVEFIYLDEPADGEFLSETGLLIGGALSTSGEHVPRSDAAVTEARRGLEGSARPGVPAVVGSGLNDKSHVMRIPAATLSEPGHQLHLRESSAEPQRIPLVNRQWKTPAIPEGIQVGLAVVVLTGILMMSAIRTPNVVVVPSIDGIAGARTPQSGTSGTAIGQVSESIRFGGEPRDVPGGTDLRQQTSPVTRSSASLGSDGATPYAAATIRVPLKTATAATEPARARIQRLEESESQMRGARDAGAAQSNPNWSAESPNRAQTFTAEPAVVTRSNPVLPDPAVRALELDDLGDAEPGVDDVRSVASIAAARAETVVPSDHSAPVRELLASYQAAYGRLDARFAKEIWPSVDERALARAFSGLESQTVTFDTCDLTVSGARAVASCRGNATFMTRIGRRNSHTESRQWTFLLEKSAERWVIGAVQIH